MSWGTYYKHEGYLSRIGKNEIPAPGRRSSSKV